MFNLPPGVKYAINDGRGLKYVTYAEIRRNRIANQAERLNRITALDTPCRQAAYIWVFFVPGVIYGGWHLYLRTLRESFWIGRDFGTSRWNHYNDLCQSIIEQVPCGVLPVADNFERWKIAFSEQFRRPGKRKQGICFGWADFERGYLRGIEVVDHRRNG